MTTMHTILDSAFGELQLVGSEDGLQMLHLAGQRHFIEPPAGSVHDPHAALFLAAQQQLAAYAAGELHEFDLPIDLSGSASQLAVWTELQGIPYGETTTYGAIAKQIGKPGMAQAVGQHVGHNPIAIVVPCHRVIGANGSLTGYAGGLERKRQLLQLEGALQAELL